MAALIGAGTLLSAAAVRDGIGRIIDSSLVGEALNREEPRGAARMLNRVRGYSDEDAQTALLEEKQRALESLPHETVEITGSGGTRLVGHLFEAKHPRRAIVAMHGWRSGWARDFGPAAEFFRDSGCTVLYPEQRGQGQSDGTHMGFGMLERFDCVEWVRMLNERGYAQMPVYLAGISMGAATVLMAGGSADLPGNVRGIIADCGFTSARAEWEHIARNNLGVPYRSRRVDGMCRRRIALEADAYSTLDAMKTCTTPVLFIHGDADSFVPLEMTLENYRACSAPKHLLIVPGANHGMSYLTDRESYERAVRNFWAENDSALRTSRE